MNSLCLKRPIVTQPHVVFPFAHVWHPEVIIDASSSCLSSLAAYLADSSKHPEPTYGSAPTKDLPTFSLAPHSLSSNHQFSTARASLSSDPLKPCHSTPF